MYTHIYIKSSVLVQVALYFSNSFSSFIQNVIHSSPSLTLNVLTYPLILRIIKTNGLMTLAKYSTKYLELIFVLINFEITILSGLNLKNYDYFLAN